MSIRGILRLQDVGPVQLGGKLFILRGVRNGIPAEEIFFPTTITKLESVGPIRTRSLIYSVSKR